MKRKINSYFFYDFARVTGVPALWMFYRMKKVYVSPEAKKRIEGGAILVSNHSGFTDPAILVLGVWYRRQHFVATKELFDTPIKRFVFEHFHCIEIDRDNVGLDTFRAITDRLKEGRLVSVFPEGHITEGENIEQFKSGVVLMSVSSQKPIIPVYIKKRKSFWHRQCMIFGEPVDPVAMLKKMPSLSDMDKIAQYLREKEGQLKKIADKL